MQTDAPRPNPVLRIDPNPEEFSEFTRGFYRQDTTRVARKLIGSWLARRYRGAWYGARIVETEAYLGSKDSAAHSRGGHRSPRVEPMYMDGGHLYVFLVYGMHHCANVVTRKEGVAEAVLLRAAEGPAGTPSGLLSGPGKLSRALGITVQRSGTDLLSSGDLRIYSNGDSCGAIACSRRIGVEYAGHAADWPLRFFDANSPAVSGPPRLKSMALPPSAQVQWRRQFPDDEP